MTERVFIHNGQLVVARTVGAFNGEALETNLAYQIYRMDNGEPAELNYRGPATFNKSGGRNRILLGDPYKDTNLYEYEVDPDPIHESVEHYEGFIAGAQKKRKMSDAQLLKHSDDFRLGYYDARKEIDELRLSSRRR